MKRMLLISALALAGVAAQAQDDPIETHVYNVEFLTRTAEDWPGEDLGLTQDSIGTMVAQTEMASARISGEDIAQLIRTNIAEDTWQHVSAAITASNGTLTVTQRRSVHVKIQQYLDYWRSLFGKMVVVEANVLSVTPALWARVRAVGGNTDRPAALSPDQLKQLLDAAREGNQADLVKSMRVTAHPGQRVSLQEKTRQYFIRDLDVQIATSAAVLDPIIDMFSTGVGVDVRPWLEPFGDAVTMEVRAVVAEQEALEERTLRIPKEIYAATPGTGEGGKNPVVPQAGMQTTTAEAKVQHPRLTRDAARTTVTAKNKETFLVASVFRKGRHVLFLLTPSVVALEEKPVAEPAFEEQRLLRLFDISPLTRGVQDWPGPRLDLTSPSSAGGAHLTGATFTLDEPAVLFDKDHVVEMIKHRVAADTWGNKRNLIEASKEGTLFIRQKPEVLKEIETFLSTLVMARAQMITTEAVVLGFKKGARGEWEKEVPALAPGGYFAEQEKFDRLYQEALRGARVRLVETGEISCFPQERVHAMRVEQETWVADYEPQVGSYAVMHDPVVNVLMSGFLLDVRPHFIQGTEKIGIDLRCALTQREFKELDKVLTGLSPIQMPRMTQMSWNSAVTCVKGRWTCVAIETRGKGEAQEEFALFVRARANLLK